MTKKDINYVKHIKKIVKKEEHLAVNQHRWNEYQRMESLAQSAANERETQHTERCKEAAKMTPYARLVNYAGTGDATYLGSGCDWDIRTRLGYNQRLGGL
jgi:hypothetical protein